MAIYKNREVELLGPVDGASASPTYAVLHKDNNREHVALNLLQLTDEEFKNLQKQHGDHGMFGVNKIDNKDLQELRDGQDKAKVEARQKNNPQTVDVPVSQVKVNANEVAQKAGINSSVRK